MLNVIVSGVITGLLYGLAGLSMVVSYRSARIVNFGLGGIGGIASYFALQAVTSHQPYWLGYIVAVLGGALLSSIGDVLILRPLSSAPRVVAGVSTLGVLLTLEGIVTWKWGTLTQALPSVGSTRQGVHFPGSVMLTDNNAYTLIVCLLVSAAVLVLIQYSRVGLAMRATSAGPLTSRIIGVNVPQVRLAASALAGAIAALAALLVTPIIALTPTSFPSFIFVSFIAVVIGGFTSLWGVVLGGVAYGVVINLGEAYITSRLTQTMTFVLIAIVLAMRPNGIFGRREHTLPEPTIAVRAVSGIGARGATAVRDGLTRLAGQAGAGRWRPQSARGQHVMTVAERRLHARREARSRQISAVLVLVLAVILPFVTSSSILSLLPSLVGTYFAVLGLNVLGGFCGQLSVGQGGLMAVGAYLGAIIAQKAGIPSLATLPIVFVVTGVVGLIIGLPATRLKSEVYLTVLTLVFATVPAELAIFASGLTGGENGTPYTLPLSLSSPRDQYFVFGAMALFATGLTALLVRSSIGRSWRSVRDAEAGAASLGINPAAAKLLAFTFSAGLTGVGGAIAGLSVGYISPDYYDVWLSVYLVVAVIVGGMGSLSGSFLGALFITLIPVLAQNTSLPQDSVYGVLLILVLIFGARGLFGILDRLVSAATDAVEALAKNIGIGPAAPSPAPGTVTLRVREQPGTDEETHAPAPDAAPRGPAVREVRDPALLIDGLSGGYGIIDVVSGIELAVPRGQILCLLGANGAGKSTLLRLISGVLAPTSGKITIFGTERPPDAYRVAHLGVAHIVEGRGIFPDLTVEENVRLGTFGRGDRSQRRHVRPSDDIFDLFPLLRDRRSQLAGTLSGGQQQMVAIIRAMQARPRLLLLDEPTLGLAPLAAQEVLASLAGIRDTGVSILLVEQNAHAALAVADLGVVLGNGVIRVSGSAAELRSNPRLTAAYLGVEDTLSAEGTAAASSVRSSSSSLDPR